MTVLNPEATQTPPTAVKNESAPQTDNSIVTEKKAENPEQSKEKATEADKLEDPNWKAFREARKKDRTEREAAERRAAEKEQEAAALKAAMEAAFSKSAPSPQAYQQYYGMNQPQDHSSEESEEQRIERKVNELLAKKEEQHKIEQSQYEQREYPNRLKRDFPDFAHVCSQENLDYLDFHYPELSRPLQRLSEGYDKWSDIYHAVKKFIPNHSTAKKEAARAEINGNKPRSISSTGPSPSGEPVREGFQDTEARRAANWQRMQRLMKGV